MEVVAVFGFIPLLRAPTMFKCERNGAVAFLQLYVDDFLLGSTDVDVLDEAQEFMFKKFKVKCTNEIKKFVGIELDLRKEEIFIHSSV